MDRMKMQAVSNGIKDVSLAFYDLFHDSFHDYYFILPVTIYGAGRNN
ncbi:MAG: hypothetical protein GY757_20855 [bacterium]|nr:hypothetical protein [bacterium]